MARDISGFFYLFVFSRSVCCHICETEKYFYPHWPRGGGGISRYILMSRKQLSSKDHLVGQLLWGFQSSRPPGPNMGAENWNFLKLLKTMIEGALWFCLGLLCIRILFLKSDEKLRSNGP